MISCAQHNKLCLRFGYVMRFVCYVAYSYMRMNIFLWSLSHKHLKQWSTLPANNDNLTAKTMPVDDISICYICLFAADKKYDRLVLYWVLYLTNVFKTTVRHIVFVMTQINQGNMKLLRFHYATLTKSQANFRAISSPQKPLKYQIWVSQYLMTHE